MLGIKISWYRKKEEISIHCFLIKNLHIYGPVISNNFQQNKCFDTWSGVKTASSANDYCKISCKINGPCLILYTKINSKWITYVEIRSEYVKYVKENIRKILTIWCTKESSIIFLLTKKTIKIINLVYVNKRIMS